MKNNPASQSGIFNSRVLIAFALCAVGVFLAMLSFAASPPLVPEIPKQAFVSAALRTELAPAVVGDWSIVSSPNADPTQTPNFPSGVTCVSASDCWAVGYYLAGAVQQTLIEHWDGTSWMVVPSPNRSPTLPSRLNAVTCVSTSDCWAVGYDASGVEYQPLIERWDGTSWTIVAASPNYPAQSTALNSVTCVSTSDCWAVGVSVGNNYQTLVYRWTGVAWITVNSPNSETTKDNYLSGVTCVSTSDCWAVGYYVSGFVQRTFIQHWNGISWTVVTSPSSGTSHNILNGVTCTSASNCWAIGYYFNGSRNQTLIERWDGTSWTRVASPNTSLSQANVLNGVTCASASDCWAVGYYVGGGSSHTLVERWDGTSWAIIASPNTSTTQNNVLTGVTCVSAAADCWAVGYYAASTGIGSVNKSLIERWDGTSWAIVAAADANTKPNNGLFATTCASASDCWAVGSYYDGRNYITLIERWNGSSWDIITSPTASTLSNSLFGVTCVSDSDCWAVGYYTPASHIARTLIERWDGNSWTIATSPNAFALGPNVLTGVTCLSGSDCWAVGYFQYTSDDNLASDTIVEHWDGNAWLVVSSPNALDAAENYLTSVTCSSTSNCWGVGYYTDGTSEIGVTIFKPLIEHWDGSSWTIVASPDGDAVQESLNGVTCVSSTDCWAVGYSDSTGNGVLGNVKETLIMRWNGSSWGVVSSPNQDQMLHNRLNGITCLSASDCWAVGISSAGEVASGPGDPLAVNKGRTLIEHWDGTVWTIIASPNATDTQSNFVLGVTCAAPWDCWAVGQYGVVNDYRTLALKFTGIAPPLPTSVVSRKTHGSAGDFDIDLPLTGNPGIECRTGGTNNDHQMLVTFANAVTFNGASVTSGTGTISSTSGSGTTTVTVNLTGVTNAQTITLTLSGVNDGVSAGDVAIPMAVLLGDTTGNGAINSSDISQIKSQSGQFATTANSRQDVTASGAINSSDISLVKAGSGTALP